MKEVELKVLGIDREAVIDQMKKLGAVLVYQGLMKIRHFDFPDGRIWKAGERCRLRDLGDGRVEFTYKDNPRIEGACKVYDELEVFLGGLDLEGAKRDDFGIFSSLMQKLGLQEILYFEKKRWNYAYNGLHFEIDQFPRIPAYVEIEACSSDDVYRGIKLLSLENYEVSNLDTVEYFRQKYPDVKLNGLRFEVE